MAQVSVSTQDGLRRTEWQWRRFPSACFGLPSAVISLEVQVHSRDRQRRGGWSSPDIQSHPTSRTFCPIIPLFFEEVASRVSPNFFGGTRRNKGCSWISTVFCVKDVMRLKKQLGFDCFMCEVRVEAEETVQYRVLYLWSTIWGWRNSWVSTFSYMNYEFKLTKQLFCVV